MRTLLDDSLVGIALLASALYAIYSLGPRTLRGRMRAGMAAALRGWSAFPPFRVLAQRLQAASPKGACGECAGCGAGQPASVRTMGKVQNVIFDLGGVVLDWNPDRLVARFQPLPELRPQFKEAVFGHADWQLFDRGTLTESEMLERMATRTGRPRHELEAVMDAVRESLAEKPETVRLIRTLQARGVPLFCLSNMPETIYAHLRRRHSFWDAFQGVVISSQVRMIKPEPEVFVHLLDKFGLRAEESVFIDDVAANVDAAKSVGLNAIRFSDAAQCQRELERLWAA